MVANIGRERKRCFTLVLVGLALITESAGYCWEPGRNPGFKDQPTVQQIAIDKVRLSWGETVETRECADQFLVKYWIKNQGPDKYQSTEMVNNTADSIDIKVVPRITYMFEVVARESKPGLLGVDWNRAPVVEFTTSRNTGPSPNGTNAEVPDYPTDNTTIAIISIVAVCIVLLVGGVCLFFRVKMYSS